MPCGIGQADLVRSEDFQGGCRVSSLERGQDQTRAMSLPLNVELLAGRDGFFLGTSFQRESGARCRV
jgi:hypothetical protein